MLGLALNIGVGDGGGPLWTPKSLPGLALWLRGDMGVTLNGAKVSAWADQSGNGDAARNVVQATAAQQPTFVASDANYNNKPTLSFLSVNILLKSGTWAAPVASPLSIFIVGNDDGSNIGDDHRYFDGLVLNTLAMGQSVAGWGGYYFYNGGGLTDPTALSAAPRVRGVDINGASSHLYNQAITAKATGALNASSVNGFAVGNATTGPYAILGQIAEMIAYDHVLSLADRTTLMKYLGTRYGIAIGA